MTAWTKSLTIIWIILIALLLKGCASNKDKDRRMNEMSNLNIQELRDRNIPINLVQYRNVYEDDPTREEKWMLLMFDQKVGYKQNDIVFVANAFHLVDGETLLHICEVSDVKTTEERIKPYLQRTIDRGTLLK